MAIPAIGIHGPHRIDEHGVGDDFAGATRVTGAAIGDAPAERRANAKLDLNDPLLPRCDDCRLTAVARHLVIEGHDIGAKIGQVVNELGRRENPQLGVLAQQNHLRCDGEPT
jgi:hypothetical protein